MKQEDAKQEAQRILHAPEAQQLLALLSRGGAQTLQQAAAAAQRGDMAGALTHYSKAATIQESDKALTGLGLVHMNQNDHEKAFSLFSRALDINPANAVALGCLVKEGYALRRVEEILPYLSASLEATNEENTRITLAGCLVSLDRRDEARRYLSEVLAANPNNSSAQELYDYIAA